MFVILFSQDAFARIVWQKYKYTDLALLLDRSDAKLAMEIGNHYFNGPACAKASAGKAGCYDLNKAEDGFRKAISIDPKIFLGNYQLARVYFVKGKNEAALLAIDKELEANPENLRSLYVRGLILAGMGDLSGAEGDFRRFTLWAPKEWAGYNDLAWVLAKQEKYGEARDAILKAFENINSAKENAWLQNSIGVAYLNLKDYQRARQAFLAAQVAAEKMNEKEWIKAYPGNDPDKTKESFMRFKEAINLNLAHTSIVDNR